MGGELLHTASLSCAGQCRECPLLSQQLLWGLGARLPAWESCPPNGFCNRTCLVGPGIAPTVKTGEEVGFVVDAKSAGKGKVTCTVLTPDGTEAEADVVENEDGTYDIFYTAAKPGTYVIYVRFGGVDIPNSPFTVMVSQLCSTSTSHSDSCFHVLFSDRLTACVIFKVFISLANESLLLAELILSRQCG